MVMNVKTIVLAAGVSGLPSESYDYMGAAAPHDMEYGDKVVPMVDEPYKEPSKVVPVDDKPYGYEEKVDDVYTGPGYGDSKVVPDWTGPGYGDSEVVPDWTGPGYGGDKVVDDWAGPGYGGDKVVPIDNYPDPDDVDDWFDYDPDYSTSYAAPKPTDGCSDYDVDDIYTCVDPDYIDLPICDVEEIPVYETITKGEPECVEVVATEVYTELCAEETMVVTEMVTEYETCDPVTVTTCIDHTEYTCAGTKTVDPPAHTQYQFEYEPVYIHPVEYITYSEYVTPHPTTKTTATVSETVKETPIVYSTVYETTIEKIYPTHTITKPGETVYEPTYSIHYAPASTEILYKTIDVPYGCLEPIHDPYAACPTATWGADYPDSTILPDDLYPAPSYGNAVLPDSYDGPSYGDKYSEVDPVDLSY